MEATTMNVRGAWLQVLMFATIAVAGLVPLVSTSANHNQVHNRDTNDLVCTSEREICLPRNYSQFQLPNKGNVTIVSIGESEKSDGGKLKRKRDAIFLSGKKNAASVESAPVSRR